MAKRKRLATADAVQILYRRHYERRLERVRELDAKLNRIAAALDQRVELRFVPVSQGQTTEDSLTRIIHERFCGNHDPLELKGYSGLLSAKR
jgi:hypothetical protein